MAYRNTTFVLLLALIASCGGCASTDLHRKTVFDDARREQQQGRLERAILYYQSYLRQSPAGPQAEEARFRLGECYALSGQLSLAYRELQSYLLLYPQGAFAQDAQAYVERMEGEVAQIPASTPQRPIHEREQEVERLEQQVREHPEETLSRILLAEAYLDVDELALAEKTLSAVEPRLSTYAESKEFRRVQERLSQMLNRQPAYATDLYGNPGPLRVVEARGELRGDLASTHVRREVEYVVTGYVANQSGERFDNVRVQVNLYQFGERLLAARTIRVGSVPGWGRRAFSATIPLSVPADEQVWRFECQLTY